LRLLACMTTALIAAGAVAAGSDSGVHGVVTLSPTCGGPQREGDAPCQAPYADAEVRLISASGATVASTRTSSAGHYLLFAPVGHYRVQVTTPVRITRCPSPDVVVEEKRMNVVDIDCDSGMR